MSVDIVFRGRRRQYYIIMRYTYCFDIVKFDLPIHLALSNLVLDVSAIRLRISDYVFYYYIHDVQAMKGFIQV